MIKRVLPSEPSFLTSMTAERKTKETREEEMGLQRYATGYGAMIAVLLLVLAAENGVSGQAPDQSCVSNLVPCAGYLNSTTTPPDTCCEPLRETVNTDVKCLCNLYSSPEIFKSFGVNISDALQLPKLCGIKESVEECHKKGSAPVSGIPLLPSLSPSQVFIYLKSHRAFSHHDIRRVDPTAKSTRPGRDWKRPS
ncbi:hypothetical protein ACLOJK_033439 [Asimina triloba]